MAIVVVGIAVTGCSLLYNPNNLPPPSIDAPVVDADPSMLKLDGAGPARLLEGQGVDGTRPAILAITGQNFVAAATVRVFATGSETPMIAVNNNDPTSVAQVSSTSNVLTVSVTLPIDTKLPVDPMSAMQDIPLTIEVSQPAAEGLVTKTLTGAVTLRTLPELIAPVESASLRPMYSQVDLSGPLAFTAAPGTPRALIRSASTIRLKAVTASAAANAPGPGGAAGGANNTVGGGGMSGGAGSITGGGGGGFATAGKDGTGVGGGKGGALNGDPLISSYASNISAGGGGGTVAGGGGGGTLELTAAGDVFVGAITANAGAGTSTTLGLGAGGGGGAGGIVLIRSGGTATLGGAITASAGAGGTGVVGGGGDGSIGRTRIDAPKIVGSPTVSPPYHIGASFDPATPLTTTASPFAIQLSGTVADKFDVIVLDGNGGASSPPFTADFGNATMITVRPVLQPGFNRVCVTKNGGSVTVIEATNCIDVAYLP